MKLIGVVGARPNFMKIAPLSSVLAGHPAIQFLLVHTGQHYDEKMSDLFFRELKIRKPDIDLGVGTDTQARQVANIMIKFEDVCLKHKPDAIIVVGDVNSTLACSIVAAKLGIKLFHLEAGLRSFDRTMPEEINRIVTDALSDYCLTPSPDADENLLREGIAKDKIHQVGNIMIDTLYQFLPIANNSTIYKDLAIEKKNYALVTLHRPSNVDSKEYLECILKTLNQRGEKYTIIFPVHPRTLKNINKFGLESFTRKIKLTEPLGYINFLALIANAAVVITDSGGVQEETTALKIPCITLRKNTERPITVSQGTNVLVGSDMKHMTELVDDAFAKKWKISSIPLLWDGNTTKRVLEILEKTKL